MKSKTPCCSAPRSRSCHSSSAEGGLALVFVLWIMAVLCAVALALAFASHLRVEATANFKDTTQAFFLARAGVERAVAEVVQGRDGIQVIGDLQESATRTYKNVKLGDGTYTLYVGADEAGEPRYGISDEAARINVNQASEAVLLRVPGMTPEVVTGILALRAAAAINDLDELVRAGVADLSALYGEDQNRNGLLDPNEDDADATWPPDNADGRLDQGLAPYLTVWSAARNVTAAGTARVGLNSATEEDLIKAVPGLTPQEAYSIVEYRKKQKFASIANLLDVELVEKPAEKTKPEPPKKKKEEQEKGKEKQEEEKDKKGEKSTAEPPSKGSPPPPEGGAKEGSKTEPPKTGEKPTKEDADKAKTGTESTAKKAFDLKRFRAIADLVATSDDEVIKGLVNLNTAPREILACLPGIDEALALNIVRWREDRPSGFQTVADLLEVTEVSESVFRELCPLVSARSDVFHVRSFGVVGAENTYCGVAAVIDRTGETCSISSWRELE